MRRILAALVVVPVLLVARCAAADPIALPVGTTITCPEDRSSLDEDARASCPAAPLVTREVLFAVPRSVLERGVASEIEVSTLEADLRACNESVRRVTQPAQGSGFWRAAKWTAIGGAIVGAFALGLAL